MTDKGIYFGRFQPFHLQHLGKVQQILAEYSQVELSIGIADWKGQPSRSNFLSGTEAVTIARLSLEDYGIRNVNVVPVELRPEVPLEDMIQTTLVYGCYSYVFSGSEKTLAATSRVTGYGIPIQIIDLKDDEKGVRATNIREWMVDGDFRWQGYVAPSAKEFLARADLDIPNRLKMLTDGEKRPWKVSGENGHGFGSERR